MPFVQITLIEGRRPEQLRNLMAKVTDAVADTTGAPKDAIRVVLNEVPATHWSVGGVPKGGFADSAQATSR